jgi:hypothetical protein
MKTSDSITMRTPFLAHQISKLPKPTKAQTDEVKADFKKGVRCEICGGWHHPKVVHLDYVGHAALTDRLLDVDVNWTWEPVAFDPQGLPSIDKDGGLWIRLTVLGVTRLGYGDAQGKTGGDAMKERIGDALRNAAMRFGAALDLWHKGDLYLTDDEQDTKKGIHKPTDNELYKPDEATLRKLSGIVDIVMSGEYDFGQSAELLNAENLDSDEKVWVWNKLDSKTRSGIKKYNAEQKAKAIEQDALADAQNPNN